MSDNKYQQICEDFFKAPNGTFFLQQGDHDSCICATKLPLAGEERFSIVMCRNTYSFERTDEGLVADTGWRMDIDSYVDNETGTRLLLGNSAFKFAFGYTDGIDIHTAIHEIEDAVSERLYSLSDEELISLAKSNGDDPEVAMVLDDNDLWRINKECRQAFVFDRDPKSVDKVDLMFTSHGGSGQFAYAFLKDKQALIDEKISEFAPQKAAVVLRNKALLWRTNNIMEQLRADPSKALIKERDIRKAIEGKSSVWVTFGDGEKTFRMSAPIDTFKSEYDGRLNLYALSDKAEKSLAEFFQTDTWHLNVYFDDIVAIDYKGKTIYQDDGFYEKHAPNTKAPTALDSLVNDAQDRATNQHGSGQAKQPELSK